MSLLNSSKMFLKKNASTILTYVGAAGVIATTVTAVKATPKALLLLQEAEKEKEQELTVVEKVKVAGPAYIPSVVIGVGTIACIFGANVLNKRQQAALMSAYALLDNSYKEYRAKVKELYGDETDKKVKEEIVKDKHAESNLKPSGDNKLFYDSYSDRYFESTMEKVLTAEYKLNRMLSIEYGAYLNEFYELLEIDTVDYGNYIGWSVYELSETQWHTWVEFEHTKVVMDDGLECTIIDLRTDPSFDFENY